MPKISPGPLSKGLVPNRFCTNVQVQPPGGRVPASSTLSSTSLQLVANVPTWRAARTFGGTPPPEIGEMQRGLVSGRFRQIANVPQSPNAPVLTRQMGRPGVWDPVQPTALPKAGGTVASQTTRPVENRLTAEPAAGKAAKNVRFDPWMKMRQPTGQEDTAPTRRIDGGREAVRVPFASRQEAAEAKRESVRAMQDNAKALLDQFSSPAHARQGKPFSDKDLKVFWDAAMTYMPTSAALNEPEFTDIGERVREALAHSQVHVIYVIAKRKPPNAPRIPGAEALKQVISRGEAIAAGEGNAPRLLPSRL